ncbi:MAG: aldehyde dehydrogenase family protein [Pseudonocardia sp.]
MSSSVEIVAACGSAAQRAAPSLAAASQASITTALEGMALRLSSDRSALLAENARDVAAAEQRGMTGALLDRLRLSADRLDDMAKQLRELAAAPVPPRDVLLEDRPDGLRLVERRRPVGVIGANFEARPNVTVDVASQLVKSRNAGVLRTGSAAMRSAVALRRAVIAPALAAAGLDPEAMQLVDDPSREAAVALVGQPGLIPLVILRGSGETTRTLAAEAARHGVRTLAHADGGGVLYVDADAELRLAEELVEDSVDRLGVCNRLNLLLVDTRCYDEYVPKLTAMLERMAIRVSAPPHAHPLGHEWALDAGREATVTLASAGGPADAAAIANRETSGLAATIVTTNPSAAQEFIDAYAGTGAFWNASTRLLDGYKLRRVPETGINVDHVPGPRGPVTFQDLYLRQYVVVPR